MINVNYVYDVENECFKREDGRGRPFQINIVEAKKIETLVDLGYSVQKIYDKIDFNGDVSITNLRTFINNYKRGNMDLDKDYPAPQVILDDITMDTRVTELEAKVQMLENNIMLLDKRIKKITDSTVRNKITGWFK